MDNSFEARLGLPVGGARGDKSDKSSSADEDVEGGGIPESVVLVVMDVNKELSLNAFHWALSHVVQAGDYVKLLGILQHIMNPMGYRSRADENSWNGASRKVLEEQIATHLAIFKNIPAIYSSVERLGAKLEIDVRANLHSKNVVIEEAKRLRARYVVIDRHIKKDKKFYIENLTCYVTRVKTITNFEHLRHGVPVVDEDKETTHTDDTSIGEASNTVSHMISQDLHMRTNPQAMQMPTATPPLQHQPHAPALASNAVPIFRPSNFCYDESTEGSLSGGVEYGPELMGNTYQALDMDISANHRELAVRRWLTDSGYRVDPAFRYPTPDYGYMAMGHSGEAAMYQIPMPLSPFTEAALADRMSNLNTYNPSVPLPPLSSGNENAYVRVSAFPGSHTGVPPRSWETHARSSKLTGPQAVSNVNRNTAALLQKYQGGNNSDIQVSTQGDGHDRAASSSSHAPVSVQPRRADANWALDLLGSEFMGQPQMYSIERQAVAEVESSSPEDTSEVPVQKELNLVNAQDSVDRISSVRRAVSSKKASSGTPPLCSVCHQKSPSFGRVKKFTYAELQEATNNFSADNYLAEGGYGSVYKGRLKEGQLVAVKQHKLASSQGDEEFCAEVEVLSCAQHRNLVTLIGYCVEKHLRLLVYEYVCNGSLDRHLSAKSKTNLQWHQRHKIALGAARALCYLHEECRVGCIVHRDMRPNNILLTHDFTPMVGDFGLARRQSSGDMAEETRVLGTIGYLAPEYAETGQITDKADVYAFGVVLLELITGRKAIEHSRPKRQVSLTEWARPLLETYDKGLVDPRLTTQYEEYELHCMMHAANQCIKRDPTMRPRMTQVLRILNPPQERDWAYGPGRLALEIPIALGTPLISSPGEGHLNVFSKSTASSCSQSDSSVASHSDTNSQCEFDPSFPHPHTSNSKTPLPKFKPKVKLMNDKAVQDEAA